VNVELNICTVLWHIVRKLIVMGFGGDKELSKNEIT
jgi:hypothetical protein